MAKKNDTGSQSGDGQAGTGASSSNGLGPQSKDALTAYIANLYQISNGQIIPQKLLVEAFHFCMEEAAKRAGAANDQTAANTQLILVQVRWFDAQIFLQIAESRRLDELQAATLGTPEERKAKAEEDLKRQAWERCTHMLLTVTVFVGGLCLGVGVIGSLQEGEQNNPLYSNFKLWGGSATAAGIGTIIIKKWLYSLLGKTK